MLDVSLTLAFVAGLVSFFSPCVLPLVPAYVSYMGGTVTYTVAAQSASGAAALNKPSFTARFSTLLHSLAFILGFTIVFVGLGLLTTAFVRVIGIQNVSVVTGIISRAGGIVIIFFGLHFMGVIASLFRRLLARPSLLNSPLIGIGVITTISVLLMWVFEDWLPALPIVAILALWIVVGGGFSSPQAFWTNVIGRVQGALYADTRRQMVARGQQNYLSSMFMGIVFSAGWTPCIGPIYGSILTLAATGGSVSQAGVQLTAYSLGLGIPFLVTALMFDSVQGVLRRLQRHLHKIELVTGALLIVIGVLVATGQLQILSQRLNTQFADFSYNLEECAIRLSKGEVDFGGFIACARSDTTVMQTPGEESSQDTQITADAATSSSLSELNAVAGITDLAGSLSPTAQADDGEIVITGLSLGNLAPDFASVTETGDPVSLSGFRGKVVLLNFWATWCGPCRIEMPEFERAYQAEGDSGFVVLGINNRETAEAVAGFREEQALTFPLIMDEDGAIQGEYGIRSYPSTFIIDREGIIRALHYGPLTAEEIAALIDDALS